MSSTTDFSAGIETYPSDALPVGRVLNGYKIKSILGRGTFGITYLATEQQLDRLVAIKEYLPQEFATRDESSTVRAKSESKIDVFTYGRNSFLNEAKTQVKFKHPNIVRVLTFFELNDTAYIVMEYEEGISLDDHFVEYPLLSQTELLKIFHPVIKGLETVHKYGFIHRDIKPRNIHIRADGSPVLLDFGSARDVVTNRTDELTRILTHGYAPYEQENPAWAGQGPWTDIYALGATLYMAVMRFKPESGSRRAAAYMTEKEDPYVSATTSEGDYSESFLKAIDKALEFYPKDRPQSLKEWLPMLSQQLEEPRAVFHTDLVSEDRRKPDDTLPFASVAEKNDDTAIDGLSHEPAQINPLLWMLPAILFGFAAIGTGIYLLISPADSTDTVEVSTSPQTIQRPATPEPANIKPESKGTVDKVEVPKSKTAEAAPDTLANQGKPAQLNPTLTPGQTTDTTIAAIDGAPKNAEIPLSEMVFAADSGIEVDEDQLIISHALEKTLKFHTENVERQPDGTLVVYLDEKKLYDAENNIEYSSDGLNLLNRLDYVFRNNQDFQILITDRANQGYTESRARGIRDFLVSQGLPWSRIQTVVNSGRSKSGFIGIEIQLIPKLPAGSISGM